MKTIYKKLLFLLLFLPFSVLAQSVLEGNVVDSKSNQPIPGVNVVIKGSTGGSSTDFDGKFKLKAKKGDKIVFSYIGYKSSTISYDGQKSVTVKLEEESNQLNEVVVQVGYGSVKKKDATGSITTITTKDFNKGANVTTDNLLNGRVAGLTINAGGGAPGSGSTIRIRGGSSLFASNDPLIVIDGLPIENSTGTGSTSFLASLNPSTVESISVLKDASATAIYGSRASNGVIIITTKKGSKTLAVDFNVTYGSGKLIKTLDVFDADTFRNVIADNLPSKVSQLGTSNTNWQKEIYRRTDFIDDNISIRGNLLKVIPARLTIGNTYQEGLRLTNTFNRNTLGMALNPTFFDSHLKLKLNANYSNENNRFADGVEGSAIIFDPTQPVRDNGPAYGGFFEYHDPVNANGQYPLKTQVPRNPVAQLLQTNDTGFNNRVFGNFELDYKLHFFPALRGVLNVGFDESNGQRTKIVGTNAATSGNNNNIPFGTNEFSSSLRRNKLLDAYFVYNKTFGKLIFDLTGGYSYQKFESRDFVQGNLNDPNLPVTGPGGFPQTNIDTDRVLVAFFGRANLNFNDKYLLTASLRRDGSSRFTKEYQFGNFPAIAFAWKMKEDFFKDSKIISDFKLRVGYGVAGQQDISAANASVPKYILGSGSSQYYFGDTVVPIAVPERLSPSLKWEETTTYNTGIDFGIYNNRVSGSIDLFYKDSKDLLVDAAVPDGTNFSNRSWQNIGSFTTKGIELAINAEVIKNDNFNWNCNFNVTKFEREITKLAYGKDIPVGPTPAGTGGQLQIFSQGYVPYSFYVYKQLYNPSGKPIEGAYADLDGNGLINDSDKYIYKNPDPKVVFGFASNMNYKNLDFSFNLRASVGNNVFNQVNASRAQYDLLNTGGALGNIPSSVLETGFKTTSKVVYSDIYVENASFLRLDNISVGYTFPKWIDGKASLRLFTGVQNAFVLTKYSGLDPEVTNNGVDNTIYPRQRSILFGVNIKF